MTPLLFKLAQPNPLATSHAGLVWRCAEELGRRGLSWRDLARAQDLSLDKHQPGARVFAWSEQAFLREAERLADDPLLGWSLGAWELRDLGLYGYSVLNAPDLRQALQLVLKLSAIVSEAAHLDLSVTNGEALLVQNWSANGVMSQVWLHMLLCHLRELVGPDFRPQRLGVHQTDPVQVQRLSDQAGMAIEGLTAPVTFVSFPASLLDRPIQGADARLASVLQKLWDQECATLVARNKELQELQGAIVALLPTGASTASSIAAALGLSMRALADKLDRIGTRLPWVVDAIRAGLVGRLLAKPNMTLLRATWALGFTDPEEFVRAHERWWGTAPRDGRGRLVR